MKQYKVILRNKYGQTYFQENMHREMNIPNQGFVSIDEIEETPTLNYSDQDEAIKQCKSFVDSYGISMGQVCNLESKELVFTYEL